MKRAETKRREESAWEQARKYGVDMSLLAANLRKTPAELLQQHQRALAMALMLREGMKKPMIQYTSPSKNPDIIASAKALRRAAKRALELGIRTKTPVYVMEKGRIVDIAKRSRKSAAGKTVAG